MCFFLITYMVLVYYIVSARYIAYISARIKSIARARTVTNDMRGWAPYALLVRFR